MYIIFLNMILAVHCFFQVENITALPCLIKKKKIVNLNFS